MTISIRMPAMSPSMEKGNIARWLKKEGDRVQIGDVLAEIETDKAIMEMEAFDAGTLTRIVVPEGAQDVAVDELIAILSPTEAAQTVQAAPPAPPAIPNSHPGKTAMAPSPIAAAPVAGDRIFASPLAKRMARDAGLELAGVSGSGPQGRIIRNDVEELTKARTAVPLTAAQPPAAAKRPSPQTAYEAGTFEYRPLDNMRRTIARRLVEAKQTIPHFYLSTECEVDALLALRSRIDQSVRRGITLNDFIVKALASALRNVPGANVVWMDDQLLQFRHSDIGVVVAVEGGLYTPVVRKVESKTLSAVSAEIKDFATRARERKLRPEDYAGGSASISNLGMYGVSSFQPIINPPHSLMLGIGAALEKVVARDGQPAIVRSFTCTMSCDHRAMDGITGAQLLTEFKRLVENPMEILV
jgi:pyruvate dehydrogenase E2 component (dihydrolipoamide acetyltransferase)